MGPACNFQGAGKIHQHHRRIKGQRLAYKPSVAFPGSNVPITSEECYFMLPALSAHRRRTHPTTSFFVVSAHLLLAAFRITAAGGLFHGQQLISLGQAFDNESGTAGLAMDELGGIVRGQFDPGLCTTVRAARDLFGHPVGIGGMFHGSPPLLIVHFSRYTLSVILPNEHQYSCQLTSKGKPLKIEVNLMDS
ncbi:hypothetical protein DESC_810134 [Desulfosarcina cetonica]|nr:hypothetical protein DESC_810134 [Desulfosarcina cetonica]